MRFYTLYSPEADALVKVAEGDLIHQLYYKKLVVPDRALQRQHKLELDEAQYRRDISSRREFVPLFDVVGYNLFIVPKEDVFFFVKERDFRLPTEEMLEAFRKELAALKESAEDAASRLKARILGLMVQFLSNYDLAVLEQTFLQVVYQHTKGLGQSITYCMRPSFVSYVPGHRPYYTQDEILKLALNMGFVSNVMRGNYNLKHLCDKIKQNDVSAAVLFAHQKHVERSGLKGLLQGYSFIASYPMNNYLRGLGVACRNPALERQILRLWQLIRDAPPFDKTYVVYRLVGTDNFLMNLQIGDVFRDPGFLSCSRNPFYNDATNQFGYIVWKIKIPRKVAGVGLCIESYSLFHYEDEIVLPPGTGLRLVSIDKRSVYHHVDQAFQDKITGIYEFEWIGRAGRPALQVAYAPAPPPRPVNFMVARPAGPTLEDRVHAFYNNFVDQNDEFILFEPRRQREYRVRVGFYDSTTVYRGMYHFTTPYGFYLYTLHEPTGQISCMMELGMATPSTASGTASSGASGTAFSGAAGGEGGPQLAVGFQQRFLHTGAPLLDDEDVLALAAQVAHGFAVTDVVLHARHRSCLRFKKRQYLAHNDEFEAADMLGYNEDLYSYLKEGTRRFAGVDAVEPAFLYYKLDQLRTLHCSQILHERDRNMLYKLHRKFFLGELGTEEARALSERARARAARRRAGGARRAARAAADPPEPRAADGEEDTIANFYVFVVENLYTKIKELDEQIAEQLPAMARLFRGGFFYRFDPVRWLHAARLLERLPLAGYFGH